MPNILQDCTFRTITAYPEHDGKRAQRFEIVFNHGMDEWRVRVTRADLEINLNKIMEILQPIDGYNREGITK